MTMDPSTYLYRKRTEENLGILDDGIMLGMYTKYPTKLHPPSFFCFEFHPPSFSIHVC